MTKILLIMKKYLKKIALSAFITGFIISFTACEKVFDDFLAEPQLEGQTTTESYWVAVNEMDKLMNGSYAVMLGFSGNGFGQSVHHIANITADFVAPYEPNYVQLAGALGVNYYRRENNITNWNDHTRVLQYASNAENIANALIEKLGSGDYDNDPDYEVLGKILLGEAYAMRALINFEYTRYFGKQYHETTLNEKAWIYRKKYITGVRDAYKGRETVEDSYNLLLEDVDKAIDLLPEEYDPEIHPETYAVNRFHKGFAQALKAEILFQMNDFQNCKTQIDQLIGVVPGSPDKYPLDQYNEEATEDGFPASVYYNFTSDWFGPSKNQEVIFAFAADAGTAPVRADRNQRWALFLPPVDDMNQSRANFEYSGRRAVWRMSQHFIDYVDFDKENDLRFQYLIDEIVSSDDGNTYWWPLKFNMSSSGASGQNVLWFRSAQFLLMRAEINARTGNSADAIADLNAVRIRAGIGEYQGSDDDTGNLLQDIIKERAREMFLERYRIWDLLRLGAQDGTPIGQGDRLIVPTTNPGFDAAHTGTDPIPWNSNIWPYAIPDNESIYNPDVLN